MASSNKSYAKLNLFLQVTDKLANGYHEIYSLFVPIDIFDLVELSQCDKFTLEIKGEFASQIEDLASEENIVYKALQQLSSDIGQDVTNVKIDITKNIPTGGGVGGGSSNAASVLLQVNDFFDLGLTKGELAKVGFKIGSDVPFFIYNKPCLVSGTGGYLEFLQNFPNDFYILLVNPYKVVSTKGVYEGCKVGAKYEKFISPNSKVELFAQLKNYSNDLQEPAIKIEPEIKNVLNILSEQKDCMLARMSGSGSSCFALFDSKQSAQLAKESIAVSNPDWWLEVVKPI